VDSRPRRADHPPLPGAQAGADEPERAEGHRTGAGRGDRTEPAARGLDAVRDGLGSRATRRRNSARASGAVASGWRSRRRRSERPRPAS
jgi:hypothetical protein